MSELQERERKRWREWYLYRIQNAQDAKLQKWIDGHRESIRAYETSEYGGRYPETLARFKEELALLEDEARRRGLK